MSAENGAFTWAVDLTLPKNEKRQWVQNKHYNVVCDTVERCIELIRQRHPDCTLIAVHRTGRDSQTIVDRGDA